jgi:hypothetical protein
LRRRSASNRLRVAAGTRPAGAPLMLDLFARLELDPWWSVGLCVLSLAGVGITVRRWRRKVGFLSVSGFLASVASALGWFFQAWSLYAVPETHVSPFGGCVVFPLVATTAVAVALLIFDLADINRAY